jgi:hypothetical protein
MVKFFQRLKAHPVRWVRVSAGSLLVFFGLLGFLPVVGFWMIPLGLVLLSVDFHWARRLRRNLEVRWGRWREKRATRKRLSA